MCFCVPGPKVPAEWYASNGAEFYGNANQTAAKAWVKEQKASFRKAHRGSGLPTWHDLVGPCNAGVDRMRP